MRKLIPPLVLFLIGIGYWYYDRSTTDINSGSESSKDKRTEDKPVTKKRDEKKDSVDKPLAKKNVDSKDSLGKEIYGDPFPVRYLSDWKTDEGPMILMQGPDMHVRGFYYYEDDLTETKGRITTKYIQKDNRKILSGYWVQDKSLKKCDYQKYGSYYWGRLAFDFKGDSFVGIWGYCDDKTNGKWNGRLV